jgi:hypothetical protein
MKSPEAEEMERERERERERAKRMEEEAEKVFLDTFCGYVFPSWATDHVPSKPESKKEVFWTDGR